MSVDTAPGLISFYLQLWNRSLDFSGRSTRANYWWAVLAQAIVNFILLVIGAAFHPLLIISFIYEIIAVIPGLALTFRRLHDTNRSGWWLLLSFIPFVSLILLVFFARPSSPDAAMRYQWG